MCHKNRAEDIKSLWDRIIFVKLNSCIICGNVQWIWARIIEIKQVLNICPMEIFFPSHKWVSLFKLEQAMLIKNLRNFRSGSIPVSLPTTCLQFSAHHKKTNISSSLFSIFFPSNQIMHPGENFPCSFFFLILYASLSISVSHHNNSFWKYPLHFDLTFRIKNPLWVKILFSMKLADFLPCW